jgi:hypothetical protein
LRATNPRLPKVAASAEGSGWPLAGLFVEYVDHLRKMLGQ